MLTEIIRKITNVVRSHNNQNTLVQNINLDLINKNQKRVLISYISDNYKTNYYIDTIYSSNKLEVNCIIKYFIDANYVVDCIHCNDINGYEHIKNNKYDVIFGFGKIYRMACKRNRLAKKILYLTENHPKFSYEKEKERCDYYEERHHRKVDIERTYTYYTEDQFQCCDVIIYMGRDDYLDKYKVDKYWIPATGLRNNKYSYSERNYRTSKKNFLWFGSRGVIHKGLDLLIDIFRERDDINLHICGLSNKEKNNIRIPKKKNIINHGRINVLSDKYLDLVEKCSFVILPSCSEALSTSMLTCMRHSMIPIIISGTTTEKYDDLLIKINDFKVQTISDVINKIISFNDEKLNQFHYKVYTEANKRASLENYNRELIKVLNKILRGNYLV